MLDHRLNSEYGTMTLEEELKTNRAALSEPWNFDDPIGEDLWKKVANIQCVAKLGQVPSIPDLTVFTLSLAMIEKSCLLLATTTEKFRLRPLLNSRR